MLWVGVLIPFAGLGQGLSGQPVQGLIYFAVENLDGQRVDQRGVAGSAGVAFSRLNLASDTRYRIWLLEAVSLRVADLEIQTPGPGLPVRLPEFLFRSASSHDSDRDGVHDLGEFIVGTNPLNPDSDGDGLLDGPEIRQGLDALSGRAVRTGIIDGVDTPGTAADICAVNDLAIVADRDQGISVFNVFNGLNAVLIARVDTPGDAVAVACSGNLVAVADGGAGLAVIDISDPPEAFVVHQVRLGSPARAVAVAGPIAYVGLADGDLVMVDMPSGVVIDRLPLRSAIQDVALSGDHLHVLVVGRIHVLALDEAGLQVVATVDAPGGLGAGGRRLRLFAGDRLLYATFLSGYNVIDISTPDSPRQVATVNTTQFGWKQVVATGSGLALAAVSPNSTDDGPHHVSRYGVGADGLGNEFQTTFETPGVAAALSIYNGIAYVADSGAGLQVVNYQAFDSAGVPPSVRLVTGAIGDRVDEGRLLRLTAQVSDDVQVRNVEFHVNGERVATDGNFPFEHRFATPLLSEGRRFLVVRARASDTGGNATWSDEIRLELVADGRPPVVRRTVPFRGALVGVQRSVTVFFNEPLDEATVGLATVEVTGSGADQQIGTADDVVVGGVVEYWSSLNAAVFVPDAPLSAGAYRLLVRPPLADRAGNVLASVHEARFRVFDFTDEDQDGLPDELESMLGLDPTRADTDGNGVLDGLEDFDQDGLVNAAEVLFGTDPRNPDSNGNGIRDGADDPDGDGLSNAREFLAGTRHDVADTDGDGWNDEAEVTAGSDPLNPASVPRLLFASLPPVGVVRPVLDRMGPGSQVGLGTHLARPHVDVVRPSFQSGGTAPSAFHAARPPVAVMRPLMRVDGANPAIVIGKPPVEVRIGP